ncbi:MAG: hypothetical protein E4G97_00755 [Deltaproteobacteria bacterium]|nr:MAG: hypothetical protein E4G97_00755 [Deltaproteobacteria bacterium]
MQTGGTNTVGSTLSLSGGTYSLGGAGSSLIATNEIVGSTLWAGMFTQADGTNEITGTLTIGSGAYGIYNQSGGTITANSILIGSLLSSSGGLDSGYNLSGGTLVANSVSVGNSGDGYFSHILGTSQIGELKLGNNTGKTGTYTLDGGGAIGSTSLTAGTEYIGYSGHGIFNQLSSNDGVHTVGELYLGYNANAHGDYNMEGHTALNAGDEVIGSSGSGTFTQNRGTNSIGALRLNPLVNPDDWVGTGTLTLGDFAGGSGLYSMNPIDSALPELWASTEIIGNLGTGTFTQFGGTNTVTGDLYLGRSAGGIGNYTLSGSEGDIYYLYSTVHTLPAELKAVNEYIGDAGTGTFTHSGGKNTLSGDLYLGRSAGGIGTYTLSGSGGFYNDGVISGYTYPSELAAVNAYIGVGGAGTFNHNGGSNTLSGDLHVGGSGAGTYNLAGGELRAVNISIGTGAGTGTFTQTGGSNQVANILTVGENGTYTLSGEGYGTSSLRTGVIINHGAFNYSGGDLSIQGYGNTYDGTYVGQKFTNNGTFTIDAPEYRSIYAVVENYGTVEAKNTNVTFNQFLTNNGTMKATGTTAPVDGVFANAVTFNGDFTNSGTMTATHSSVTFNGVFTNNGVYNSDPSTTVATKIVVGSNGYFVGGVGDQWIVSSDFENRSTQNTLWDTGSSTLGFTGGVSHLLYIPGTSEGGFTNNFAWGTLSIEDGGMLSLEDGNTGNGSTALYVGQILGLVFDPGDPSRITNITGNGMTIFFDPKKSGLTGLTGLQYALADGTFMYAAAVPTPIPGSLVLFGSGLLGLIGIGRRRSRK